MFVLAPARTIAQSDVTEAVTGSVVEADFGEPVEGVVITIEGSDLEAATDEDGRFHFGSLPYGRITLVVDEPGFEPLRLALEEADLRNPVEIVLVWEDAADLTTTVIAPRPRTETVSTVHITTREIEAAPRRTAEDVLRLVPGLTLVQHGSEGKGHQFFLRGFDAIHGADLELTVNGVPVNEWSNVHAQGYIDLGIVIPEIVRSVVVTKGPFALHQGAFATAGTAEYQLGISPDDLGWRLQYTAGTTNRHRLFGAYSPDTGDGDELVAAEATHDEGFGENRRLDRVTAAGRVHLFDRPGEGTLSLFGAGGFSRFELPGVVRNDDVAAGRIGFYDTYDDASRGTSGRGMLTLGYELHRVGQDLDLAGYGGYRYLRLRENFTGFLIEPTDGDRRRQEQATWSCGFTGASTTSLAETLALRTGLGAHLDILDQREDKLGQALERHDTRRDLSGTQLAAHALLGLRWMPIDSIRVDAGSRMDMVYVAVTDDVADGSRGGGILVAVLPRATLRWRVFTDLLVVVAYGRGFRPPEARAFSEFDPERAGISTDVYQGGEPKITVSDAIEGGISWEPDSWYGMSLTGFATFIERESVFDHVSGVNLELNGTRRAGVELEIHSNPLSWLWLGADVTFADAKFVQSGNRVPNAPWLVGGVHAIVNHACGFRAGLRFLGIAPRPLPHGATGATLTMLDATLGYEWQWLRIELEVENLLNQQIREGEYHYASHWQPGAEPSDIPVLHTSAGPPLNARLTIGAAF